jgi:hypothetical protein
MSLKAVFGGGVVDECLELSAFGAVAAPSVASDWQRGGKSLGYARSEDAR